MRLGYRVIQANGAREALSAYETHGNEIDLVVLDIIMPEMSGGAVFEQLRRMDPEVRVLLSSGYSIDDQARTLLEKGCRAFIQKPFGFAEFSRKVREVLDGKKQKDGSCHAAEAP